MKLLLFALILLLSGGTLSLLASRHQRLASLAGMSSVISATVLLLPPVLHVLTTGQPLALALNWSVPGGDFSLLLDPLAAFFLLPLALLSLACAVYAHGYFKDHSASRALGVHWSFINLLVAALILVITAANTVLFLAAWEIMSVSSFFLVAFEHHYASVRKAAWLYLALAHLALLLLLAFFINAGALSHSLAFADFGALSHLPAKQATFLFALAAAGFGIKAGLFPLHVWLPDAHPAAPSHISALMSGFVIKTGIYGLLRVYGFLPGISPHVGTVLMLLGACGGLYGIALAILQQDIKRALAYSSIENIGIIFMGIGLGIYGVSRQLPVAALFGFAGALLHCWNHTLFKGLLFLGAGSLLHSTGTRNLDQMGGLLKRMPWTGSLMIGGSLAITALPPLNGLISEWLLYLGLFRTGIQLEGVHSVLPLLLIGVLGLTGALALIAFSRLAGIALLGEPRSPQADHAHEAVWSMRLAMLGLFSGCLAIGLFPHAAISLLAAPLQQLAPSTNTLLAPVITDLTHVGQWGGLLLLLLAAATLLFYWFFRHRPQTARTTWGCGFPFPSARIAYTGAAYAELAQSRLVPTRFRPTQDGEAVRGLFPQRASLRQCSLDPLLTRWYLPAVKRIATHCERLRWVQQGRLPVYLFYIFATCAVLLLWVALSNQGRGGTG